MKFRVGDTLIARLGEPKTENVIVVKIYDDSYLLQYADYAADPPWLCPREKAEKVGIPDIHGVEFMLRLLDE